MRTRPELSVWSKKPPRGSASCSAITCAWRGSSWSPTSRAMPASWPLLLSAVVILLVGYAFAWIAGGLALARVIGGPLAFAADRRAFISLAGAIAAVVAMRRARATRPLQETADGGRAQRAGAQASRASASLARRGTSATSTRRGATHEAATFDDDGKTMRVPRARSGARPGARRRSWRPATWWFGRPWPCGTRSCERTDWRQVVARRPATSLGDRLRAGVLAWTQANEKRNARAEVDHGREQRDSPD